MSELLKFADEKAKNSKEAHQSRVWKVLVVDDETDIHSLTEMVMADFVFQERVITFFNAYSAKEARKILRENSDIAVILLDVVMETETAGLDLVKYIREDLDNKLTRIVLRTGQPGSAPEKKVIINYDINDYKHKTELTKAKLDTAIVASIRAYSKLLSLNKNQNGLSKIIEATNNMFQLNFMDRFIEGILKQLTSLLDLEENTKTLNASAIALAEENDILTILAGTGKYAFLRKMTIEEAVPPEIVKLVLKSHKTKESFFTDNYYVGYYQIGPKRENIILLEGLVQISDDDKYLIELFSRNISIAFENNDRFRESIDTRDEILFTLGEVTEKHKPSRTHHVKRVGEIAFRLAELKGLNHKEAEKTKIAAALHDVGKILLTDKILDKETALTENEIEVMHSHTESGEEILRAKRLSFLENAALVAAQHHERWDGAGYPRQLKGKDISIHARIAAISLIYDALMHDQPYRKAWSEERTFEYLKNNSGKIFDPSLVKIFFENYPLIKAINKMYPE